MADLPPLRDVIAKYDLRAKKALGQNFLLDLNLTGRIARAAGPLEDCTVYEVGPGPGGLTRGLLAQGAKRVVAVERDPRCIAALADIQAAYPGRLEVIEGDALEIDEPEILGDGPVKIVANLPYNIGTQLLIKWLTPEDWPPFWTSLNLMFQKEVAERIVARPGGKAYGRLSVLSQWRGAARKVFDLPRQAFTPPPQVTSAIVHITPGAPIMDVSLKPLEKVTAAAFGQRRKMVRAALKQLNCDVEALLAHAGIDPTVRAENIDVLGFCRLAKAYEAAAASRAV